MARRIVIMGAGGRDFHDFNVAFRNDADTVVVAFTATQIPGIAGRRYPASLAGDRYPDGIPIHDEGELEALIAIHDVDEVFLAYSDLSHVAAMTLGSRVLASGADFGMLGPRHTQLRSAVPVVAVCASRTGSGKSQTTRHLCRELRRAGLRPAIVRHPMPYGDLEAMAVQRFATLDDIDRARPTIEEREEYEAPVREGFVVHAGVDYEAILRVAEREADVVVWDGGNNDFPFFRPDVLVTVVDALRPGHEVGFHPGETNVRAADVIVVNKLDSAAPDAVSAIVANVRAINPEAVVLGARSPVTMEPGPDLTGVRVLVVEDGPTITHGGMPEGAGAAAARAAGAVLVDPRPWAVGSLAETFAAHPHVGPVLPAMGYGEQQRRELAATIAAVECEAVVSGTPIDLAAAVDVAHPIRRVTYEFADAPLPPPDDGSGAVSLWSVVQGRLASLAGGRAR